MIKDSTVFLVGAGGSAPYLFPSGQKLLHEARMYSPSQIHEETGKRHSLTQAIEFRETMRAAQSDSIDSVLEYRPDLNEIGRSWIASLILRAEFNSRNFYPAEDDWIGYLFRQIDAGSFQDFCDRPVCFITYNYDRLIEQRITAGLLSKFKPTPEQIARYWTDRPVIHLHGAVGAFLKGAPDYVPFGAAEWEGADWVEHIPRYLEKAANSIKVVHQAASDSEQYSAARMTFKEAANAFFMGFSFGRVNVDRLELGNLGGVRAIACSRYQMTDAECELQIMHPFRAFIGRTPQLGKIDEKCELLLKNHVHEFVSRY